jgi:predicted DNA-binding ribbon-helix-helix protein
MKKRSIRIADHPTSITLEDEFWIALQGIAKNRGQTISMIIEDIDNHRGEQNLSSAIRVFVLKNARSN